VTDPYQRDHSSAAEPARGIAFDMDGVIVDSMPFHVAAWQFAFAPFGVTVPAAWIYRLEGVLYTEVASRVAVMAGLSLDETQLEHIRVTKRQRFIDSYAVTAVRGITTLLDTARAWGYRLALVTATERAIVKKILGELGVLDRFTTIISGDDVQRGKPDPEPYLAAVSALQLDPAHCFVLENAPVGVQAAKAAGLLCIGIHTYVEPDDLAQADYVLAGPAEVEVLLRQEHSRSGGRGPWQFSDNGRVEDRG
jgi:HAD superfamily hydrolase (TIGR01509 family)